MYKRQFLAFGFSGFPLGLAGAGGVLPQVAFDQMRFALLDALAFFLPVIEGVPVSYTHLRGCAV